MRGIPEDLFVGTLRDFVIVARKLGIFYVWVDALCIIQHDDEDFAKESVLMHRVYSHALLTVSICTNSSAQQSFLRPRPSEAIRPSKFVFAGSYLSLKEKSLEDIRGSSPLMERAWTFQEEFLSPRVLYWSDHGIYWNCVLQQYAEHDAWIALPPLIRSKEWNEIVEAYSSRQISQCQDRLTALAGVASKFSKTHSIPKDEYLAGFWKSTLPESLLWIVGETPTQRASWETSGPYVAPSWSCKNNPL